MFNEFKFCNIAENSEKKTGTQGQIKGTVDEASKSSVRG